MRTQRPETERVVAFGKTNAGFVGHQRTVIKVWRLQAERAVKQKLTGRGQKEISAADDFGDSHRGVVHDHGELVRRHIVVPPDDEIAEIFSRHELLRSELAIGEGNDLAVGDAETPGEFPISD